MPEEGKTELESNINAVKDIYIDRKLVDNFWDKNCNTSVCKSVNGSLEDFILNDCDERVFLLMGSDCSTEDLMMDDEILSDWSDQILFEGESDTTSKIIEEKMNVDVSASELSVVQDHVGEHKLFEQHNNKKLLPQDASLGTNVTNPMPSSITAESNATEFVNSPSLVQFNNLDSHEYEEMISCRNNLGAEVLESNSIIQQYSGTVPYSGSISLRSTSSTASTRSFTFPVLAQEWSDSPVRMPKPDKRRLRQLKHWKMNKCWICCKF